MARKNVKVVIPSDADGLIELGEALLLKHNEDPATSPLGGLDMAAFATKVTAAKAKSALAKKLRKDSETATEDRNDLLGKKKDQNISTNGTVLNIIARSRDILLGQFKGNEQHLGEWGFDVNQSSSGSGTGGGTPPKPPVP